MITDLNGNALSGATVTAAPHYEAAVESFNIYRGDPMAGIAEAIRIEPGFAMAHILKAYLLGLATEPAATAEARTVLATIEGLPLNDREASHAAALRHLLDGAWTEAAQHLDLHNMCHPRDLVALQAGHLMDFYRASARNLRDRIARVLPQWSPAMAGYPILLGMYAFGLGETGDYARAEETGRRATELQPLDCWAHHAVAHVFEMQGRAVDGIAWMMSREPHWSGDANFFKVHNWWHLALYHLDAGQPDRSLALYDAEVRKTQSAVVLDLVDASALLWRLHLTGHDVGNRWDELARTWDQHADGQSYPFNDWHAVMAYLGAGRHADVERIVEALRDANPRFSEVSAWRNVIGLPLVEGFAAFWRGDYRTVVDRLHGARFIANAFGGSHAQRDVIDWTLTEAAVRGGLRDVAQALAAERIAVKPHSPVNRSFVVRTQTGTPVGRAA
ncbi:MAG: tetratricopeptide repeat protein [Hyphomicrobiaceae bacterium]